MSDTVDHNEAVAAAARAATLAYRAWLDAVENLRRAEEAKLQAKAKTDALLKRRLDHLVKIGEAK